MSERTLTTNVQAGLDQESVCLALFVECLFDSGPLRLWSGLGPFTLNGNVFTGAGTLGEISEVEESASDVRATGVAMKLSGVPVEYMALGLAENFQSRKARVWLAFFTEQWQLIPDAVQIFSGRMDYPVIESSGDTCGITVFVESHLIDLERPRVRRYTDEDQRELYPGDTGLRFIAGLQNKNVSWSNGG